MNSRAELQISSSLGRRCLAIGYDTVIVVALWFAATAILLPITGVTTIEPGQPFYYLYPPCLLLVNWLYLAVSWRYGNQTLGMRAWRVFLRTGDGNRLGWGNAGLRYVVALAGFTALGVGFLSSLFHPDKFTWQDRASDSWLEFRAR
jgi:uncharacterized RDD family membrane protein YckC